MRASGDDGDGRGGAGVSPERGFVDDYLLYLLAAASAAASGSFHAHVKAEKLRPVEWRVLACLSDADGQMVTQLAKATLFEQSRLSKIIDQMAEAGLVRRRLDPGDRRRVRVHLTPAGARRAAPLVAAARAHEASILSVFTADEARSLKDALRRLVETSEAPAAAPPQPSS